MTDAEVLQSLQDTIAIQAVAAEYCLRLDLDEFEEWLDLFTADTIYEVFRRTLRGHDEVSDMLSQAPPGVHLGGALRIELQGDEATTLQNYAFYGDDDRFSNNGWYYRTLVRTELGWKISHTRVKMRKRLPAVISQPVSR